MTDCERCGQDTRCESFHNSLRCQGRAGHFPLTPHFADVGTVVSVLRWGMVGYGCPDLRCNRRPGHDGAHSDGKGMSWVPVIDDGLELSAVSS